MPPFLTKRLVGQRYSWSVRNVERAAHDGRLPPPKFPIGPKAPRWDLAELEQRERDAVKRAGGDGDAWHTIGEAAQRVVDRLVPDTD
jgi:hypothetical protein